MQPHEIKPDTKLCTILGYNAQTGQKRRFFNKILKLNNINATAIALNIKDEHFAITMSSVRYSKVKQMIIEKEFEYKAVSYCDDLNECAKLQNKIDFIEVCDQKVYGFCLDDEIKTLFENILYLDEQIISVAKTMLIAHRWFDSEVDIDIIPVLIGERIDG